jgi:ribosomal protein L30E
MTDALAIPGAFRLTSVGLRVEGEPGFDEWAACLTSLAAIEGAVQFWIGDALNYGEAAYGEKYSQAVSPSQAKTWTNYAYVARSVPISIRREIVSYSKHAVVAALPAEDQDRLLGECETEGYTVKELRAVIQNGSSPIRLTTCPECGATW